VPDQLPPTMGEIAERHRHWAERYAVTRAPGRPVSAKCKALAVWHEAAARQIEAMAGQGREVERLRARLGSIFLNLEGDPLDTLPRDVAVWKLDVIRTLVRTALAAPPAEEPR
jgi:hypothetical protein